MKRVEKLSISLPNGIIKRLKEKANTDKKSVSTIVYTALLTSNVLIDGGKS